MGDWSDLTDAVEQDFASVNLSQDNPVQLAALLKKFLRDLPDPLMTFKLYRLFIASQCARGHWDWKKRPGVDFFFPWTLRGLTNYVIRHRSKYSNMTSSSEALPPLSLRRLTTGRANPILRCLLQRYTLYMVLNIKVSKVKYCIKKQSRSHISIEFRNLSFYIKVNLWMTVLQPTCKDTHQVCPFLPVAEYSFKHDYIQLKLLIFGVFDTR